MASGSTSTMEIEILGMGNPLLDISSEVDKDFVAKYDIKMGNQILAEEKHMPMYTELSAMKTVEYIAGGATLNSIRIAQWASDRKNITAYIGCIGKDNFGQIMEKQVEKDGVKAFFRIDEKVATGTCACCIMDKERSLIANLAAANKYTDAHFKENCIPVAKRARVIYSAGYFLTVSPATIMMAAKITCETGAMFCMNLAAPFICTVFGKQLNEALEYCDIIFGNEDEAKAFGEAHKLADTSVRAVAQFLAGYKFQKTGRHRVAIITQGAEKTILARADGFYMEVPVAKLAQDAIVDVNAAGDAFVGGFLAKLINGASYKDCIENGHMCSRMIIQRSGCSMPSPRLLQRC